MIATIDWLLKQDNPSVRCFTLRHPLHRLEKTIIPGGQDAANK
jgi:hypothetical protein